MFIIAVFRTSCFEHSNPIADPWEQWIILPKARLSFVAMSFVTGPLTLERRCLEKNFASVFKSCNFFTFRTFGNFDRLLPFLNYPLSAQETLSFNCTAGKWNAQYKKLAIARVGHFFVIKIAEISDQSDR